MNKTVVCSNCCSYIEVSLEFKTVECCDGVMCGCMGLPMIDKCAVCYQEERDNKKMTTIFDD